MTGIEILWAALVGIIAGYIAGVLVISILFVIEWTRGKL